MSDHDGPDPIITPEIRAGIRGRARILRSRRRRKNAAAALVAVAVVATGTFAILRDRTHTNQQVVTGPSAVCPAAGFQEVMHVGERATFTVLPQGWVLAKGEIAQLDGLQLPTYSAPGATGDGPMVSVARVFTDQPPGASFPRASSLPASDRPVSVTIGGAPGVLEQTSDPDPQAGSTPLLVYVAWSPAQGVLLTVQGRRMSAAEVLGVANGLRYDAGQDQVLPTEATTTVTAAKAQQALPAGVRSGADHLGAALTSVYEALHTRPRIDTTEAPGDVYSSAELARPAWLVWADTNAPTTTWAVVDARSGAIVQPPSTGAAPWITAVADRRAPGCNPPFGVFTRSEAAEIIFGQPTPPNIVLKLSTPEAITAALPQLSCAGCSPQAAPHSLVWIAYSAGNPPPQSNTGMLDARTGKTNLPVVSVGSQPSGLLQLLDLAAPSSGATVPTTPPTSPDTAPAVIPTTMAVVGPSPINADGTKKAAPAGNGNGPGGLCTRTETGPPCGPGAIAHTYYPYTLPGGCDGRAIFDGRHWLSELPPTTPEPPTHVWIILNNPNNASWTSTQGDVGFKPDPGGPPTTCAAPPDTAVPPLSQTGQ